MANSGSGHLRGWSTILSAGSSSIPTNRSSRQSGWSSTCSTSRLRPWLSSNTSLTITSNAPRGFGVAAAHGQVIWRPLSNGRVLDILHNPEYAGAYVYGRTKTRLLCLPGEEPRVKGRTRRVRPEDWPFLIPGHHPGYITWDQFQRNQRRLDDNRTLPERGSPRSPAGRPRLAPGDRSVWAMRAADVRPLPQ